MNNFRFTKIIAGVGPTLAKETILSKIVNMVDAFFMSLSMGFDDNNKKYIDTIMKLDNSKTIILETKGKDIRIKNTINIPVQKGEQVILEYSEYAQDSAQKIYVDYAFLGDIPKDTQLHFVRSQVIIRVIESHPDYLEGEVIETAEGKIYQYDRFDFEGLKYEVSEISERDQKDILRGLEYGVHVFALSCTSSEEHYLSAKNFLAENNAKGVKILAKIETSEGQKNLAEISEIADGIILVIDSDHLYQDQQILFDTIRKIKSLGKLVLIRHSKSIYGSEFEQNFDQLSESLAPEVVDGYMLETFVLEEEVYPTIENIEKILDENQIKFSEKMPARFDQKGSFEVRDYIIHNAYKVLKEMETKAIICFTKEGYSASRLASLAPKIPIITFTQENDTYRYLGLIWGVRGYKISQSFNYENLKRIGKEMIRIIFKGNISLDDKILILQVNENNHEIKSDMINGIELYNFKNI